MKRLLALIAPCLPLYLFAQGFGSFSHDQPFFAANSISGNPSWMSTNYPVAYWRLDELIGGVTNTIFHDSSGNDTLNKLEQILPSQGSSQAGIVTNSVQFNGAANSRIWCNDNGFVGWVTNKTITGWIYPTNLSHTVAVVLYKGDATVFNWSMYLSNTYTVFSVKPTGAQVTLLNVNQSLPLSNWTFFALQFDTTVNKIRSRTATNGVMSTWVEKAYTGSPTNNAYPFSIGDGNGGFVSIRGRVDEVTMWTNILTDVQITNIWQLSYPFN